MLWNKMSSRALCMFVAVATSAQQAVLTPKTKGGYPLVQQYYKNITYASAEDVASLIQKAKNESEDGSPIVVGEVLKLAPYTVNLEYRVRGGHGDVGLHSKSAEIIYIVQGSGTIVIGGTIATDRMSIKGGELRTIGKGDFFLIPEGLPHWINQVDKTIELISIFVPRPVSAQ